MDSVNSENSEKQKVIEKIKKLLALASSPNEHEAQSAMRRAQELMLQYSVGTIDEQVISQMALLNPNVVPQKIFTKICATVAKCFGCFVLTRPDAITGLGANVEVAHHAISCIINQGQADFNTLPLIKRLNLSTSVGFWNGFAEALEKKFMGMNEIPKYPQVQDYLQKFQVGPGLTKINITDGRDLGIQSGSAAELRAGVQGSGVKGLL